MYGFALVAGVVLLLFGVRFRSRLELVHPATWRWLGTWKIRFPDGDVAEAALPEFIWSGMYRSLNDDQLNLLARRVKVVTVALAVALIVLAVQPSFTDRVEPSSCIKGAGIVLLAK